MARTLSFGCFLGAIALASLVIVSNPLQAAEFYVATNGNDNNPGTIDLPFASIAQGQQVASAGDTVWMRGGVYEFNAGAGASPNAVYFNKSGAPGQRINYWAYPGETPVFDFFDYLPIERIRGFRVDADWLHFKGLELRGVQQTIPNVNESWAIRVEGPGGDFNIFEQLDLHHNEGPGLFIANGGNNLVLNSDSHHNYDPDRGGENADGFGSHSNDDGNVFIGNRAWENSDDGYDFINSPGVVVLEDSWAWRNGYIPDTNTAAGNGAGIKAGGFLLNPSNFPDPEDVPRNIVRNSVAFDNRVQGFYANHHPGGIDWINNTAFDNLNGFDLLNDVDPTNWPADHFLRNNISFGNNTNLANANQALIDDEFNTWNAGFSVSSADFVSLSTTGVDGARQADGSLPKIDFLRLASGSNLIDAGENQRLPFVGSAPDLGAFESSGPGDFDGDSDVDGQDFLTWQRGLSPDPLSQGDLNTWETNYDSSVGTGPTVLIADADTNIEEHQPNDIEGNLPRMQSRSRDVVGSGRQHLSYIRFDLGGETGVSSAELSVVTMDSTNWLLGQVQVYGLNDLAGNTPQDWIESGAGGLNYNASGDEVPGDGDPTTQDLGSIGTSEAENLWLLGDLPENLAGTDQTITFSGTELDDFLNSRVGGLATLLIVGANGSDRTLLFGTKEAAGFEPTLTLNAVATATTTVPEPAAWIMSLLAINALCGHRLH